MSSLQKATLVFVIGASVVWRTDADRGRAGHCVDQPGVSANNVGVIRAARQRYYNETTQRVLIAEVIILTVGGVTWFAFQPTNQRR